MSGCSSVGTKRAAAVAAALLLALGLIVLPATPAVAASPVIWRPPVTLAGGWQLTALACGPGSRCVATGLDGSNLPAIVSSTNPVGGASAWHASGFSGPSLQVLDLRGMSCPTSTLCASADAHYGSIFDSTTPTGGASTWHQTGLSTNGHSPTGISCPSAALCVAVDGHGGVYSSTSPGAASPSWTSVVQINSYNDRMDSISCPTTTLCVAVDTIGRAVATTNPTGDGSAWRVTDIDGTDWLTQVSCVAQPLCVAVDKVGNVFTSANPGAATPTWRRTTIDSGHAITGVSCPSRSLCVAVDDAGNALVSTNPGGAVPGWIRTDIDGANQLSAVSCTTSGTCVAADTAGHVVTGTVAVYRPDAMIGAWGSTKVLGAYVYSATAVHELLTRACRRGSSVAFRIVVANRGNVAERYVVKGTGNQRGWTVTYLFGRTNVSRPVVAGTYRPLLNVGRTITLKVVVKVPRTATVRSIKYWLVRVTSTHAPTRNDAVKAGVKATR